MPGGPGGGAGGLAGMLMRGVAGGRGMSMDGMNPRGEGGKQGELSSDVYDVDRWKRADDLDSGFEPTMVQTVRDAWDRETEEKKKKSPVVRMRTFFHRREERDSRRGMKKRERKMEQRARGTDSRRDDFEKEHRYESAARMRESGRGNESGETTGNRIRAVSGVERPQGTLEGNTIITPEMRKASHHIPDVYQEKNLFSHNATGSVRNSAIRRPAERSLVGLETRAGIDSFFSASPLNSILLAVDSLSLGPLTLNQIRHPESFHSMREGDDLRWSAAGHHVMENGTEISAGKDHMAESGEFADAVRSVYPSMVSDPAGTERENFVTGTGVTIGGGNRNGNLITERTGTRYMDALREDREQRKYEVHIRNH